MNSISVNLVLLVLSIEIIGLINGFGPKLEIHPVPASVNSDSGLKIIPLPEVQFPKITPTPRQNSPCNIAYSFPQSGVSGMLSSLGYPGGNYPAGSLCNYEINAPVGTTMTLLCNDFVVPCGTEAFYVSLTGDRTLQTNSTGYCGQGVLSTTSIANRLFMSLRSSPTTTAARRYQCQMTVQGTATGK